MEEDPDRKEDLFAAIIYHPDVNSLAKSLGLFRVTVDTGPWG
jgi:hypothetical protein